MQSADKKRPGGSSYKRKPEAEKARRDAQAIRAQAADEHLVTGVTPAELAVKYGVTKNTMQGWIKAQQGVGVPRFRFRKPPSQEIGSQTLIHGAGGQMTDGEVKSATLGLERRIIALQAKLGFAPFGYNKGSGHDE